MTLSDEVRDAAQELSSATDATLPGVLNGVLARYIGWPLEVRSGALIDRERNRSEGFSSVVFAAPADARQDSQDIQADNAGAVIDACESLDAEKLLASYARIARAKRLKKSPPPNLDGGVPVQTTTLSVIFALRATVSLDFIAEELQRLNSQTPSTEWPDMVVVATAGTVNYAFQFPGESLAGDVLPPGPRARDSMTPPMYFVLAIRPSGAYTFNRMISLIIAQLVFFSPGVKIPNPQEITEGVSKQAIVVSGYQYNLSGELVPVPRQFYNDRYLPSLPMRVEDRSGNLLCTLQFLQWQDGGVILHRGAFSMDKILVFLGKEALRHGRVVRREELTMSYVLPITEKDFYVMLRKFEHQSQLVVRREELRGTIQKVSDEGTQTPFIARLLLGVFELRDLVKSSPAERMEFDKSYDEVLSPLQIARKSAQRIETLWREHSGKITSGTIARLKGQMIQVDESIDDDLRKEFETFVISAGRALKEGMQRFAAQAKVDIGFLFQRPAIFESSIITLENTEPALAAYLRKVRTWSEQLQNGRNDIEHKGWRLPNVMYSRKDDTIHAIEPTIFQVSCISFVSLILDRLVCCVEDLVAYCIQKQLPEGVTITEIRPAQRSPEAPERFRPTPATGGLSAWQISYSELLFEQI